MKNEWTSKTLINKKNNLKTDKLNKDLYEQMYSCRRKFCSLDPIIESTIGSKVAGTLA